MPLTDDFVSPSSMRRQFCHDLDVYVCEDCATVQTQHDVSAREYYEDYQYSVAGSATAGRFMHLLADSVTRKYGTVAPRERKILEIGSGDGSQLLVFKELGCQVLGYEPSSVLKRLAEDRGIPTIQGLFDRSFVPQLPDEFRQVDVVLLSYTLDHLPHPREFLAAARTLLHPDRGILVVEVHDLEKIFQRQESCLFEHEHTIYLTAATAASLAASEGLTVIDYDPVPVKERRANSLIFVSAPEGSELTRRFAAAPATVSEDFADPDFLMRQADLLRRGIANLDEFVTRVTAAGKTIAGYGAGGRGVMTMAAMQSAVKLRYVADKRFGQVSLVAPKSGVRVVGLPTLKESPVDEILVFSFGYMKEIQADLAAFGYRPCQFHSLPDVVAGRSA